MLGVVVPKLGGARPETRSAEPNGAADSGAECDETCLLAVGYGQSFRELGAEDAVLLAQVLDHLAAFRVVGRREECEEGLEEAELTDRLRNFGTQRLTETAGSECSRLLSLM